MNRKETENRILELLDKPPERRSVAVSNLSQMSSGSLSQLLSELEADDVAIENALNAWLKPHARKESIGVRAPEVKSSAGDLHSSDYLKSRNDAGVTWQEVPPWNDKVDVYGPLVFELSRHVKYSIEGLRNIALKEILNSDDGLLISSGNNVYEIEFKEHADKIRSLLDHYVSFQSDRILRDIIWLVVDSTSPRRMSRKALNALHRRLSTIFESDAIVEKPDQVSASKALEGLAKIARLAFEFSPDTIVTTSSGGRIIADVIVSFLGYEKSRLIDVRAHGQSDWVKHSASGAKRVLLVDSTSRTGVTLERSLGAIRQTFIGAQVRATCFASTFEARSKFGDDLLFVPITSPTGKVRPPWDTKGVHKENNEAHLLGVPAGRRSVGPDVYKLYKEMLEKEFRYTGAVLGSN